GAWAFRDSGDRAQYHCRQAPATPVPRLLTPVSSCWSDLMRYRRLSYRYAVVMATSRPRPFGEVWQRHPANISMGQPAWRPPTDIVETSTEVIVLVELAGVDHEQLDVLLFEDALIVE